MRCQNFLMNLKFSPSGPGLFSLPHSHKVLVTSTSLNRSTSISLWCPSMVWKNIPSNCGLSWSDSWNRCIKKDLIASLTLASSSIQDPSIITPLKQLFPRLTFINKWKYLELQSPSALVRTHVIGPLSTGLLKAASWSTFLEGLSVCHLCHSPTCLAPPQFSWII